MGTSVLTLGKTPQLSMAELEVMLGNRLLDRKQINKYQVEISELDLPREFVSQTGGVVKIGTVVGRAEAENDLLELMQQSITEPVLAFSGYGLAEGRLQSIASRYKKLITETHSAKVRFRILRDVFESAGLKNRYQEYQIVKDSETYILIQTTAVQDIDRFSIKDYDRPKSDKKSGMLPPKVARIMVNLADIPRQTDAVLYDPFCGSGTILMEGLDSGMSVVGSDISLQAVEASKANCAFMVARFGTTGRFRVWQQDSTQLDEAMFDAQVDGVVFEGYLGPQQIDEKEMMSMTKGMIKMYRGVIKRLALIQKPKSRLIMALPRFSLNRSVKMFDSLVDSCEKYGYTPIDSPIEYGREGAHVRRRIYQLELTQSNKPT